MNDPTGAKEGQITAQAIRLDKAIEELDITIGRVEDRLHDILHAEIDMKDVGEPEQELVPLANAIRESARRIERESDRLKSILSRIEL